ncbi:hypothetical protein HBB06_04895 [Streptomyces sp. SNU607]|uniref:hypothetical protein n=1 Tax=Streptomyces sp. SNU607 TaxID=2718875 RepID=UPI0026DEEC6E|nr:hypothetical protein [Streptomyces sp. SNU607]WKV77515.1 hypothetical protein HBB06_04895 [Streptomyces sp. SNU607]
MSLVITPVLEVQVTAPDSKPGLESRLEPLGGVPPPQVVAVGATATPLHAFSTAAHRVLPAPYRSVAALMLAVRACG